VSNTALLHVQDPVISTDQSDVGSSAHAAGQCRPDGGSTRIGTITQPLGPCAAITHSLLHIHHVAERQARLRRSNLNEGRLCNTSSHTSSPQHPFKVKLNQLHAAADTRATRLSSLPWRPLAS
jgi:hypothetical protein